VLAGPNIKEFHHHSEARTEGLAWFAMCKSVCFLELHIRGGKQFTIEIIVDDELGRLMGLLRDGLDG